MKGATAAMAVGTDRNDARAIAQAMRVGWFTAVHVKTAASQELRMLLTNRKTLLTSRVTLENEIRGTLKAFGLKVGPIAVKTFESRVIELTGDYPRLQAMVRPMPAARTALQLQYETLHLMVLKAVKSDAVCRRLLTVPGVGPVTALAYATAIDDPKRFRHSRDVGAHLGLTPRKYASGEIDRNGAISKSGDQLAREALFLAAHTPADAGDSLVDTQGLGHGRRQAARDPPCHHRGCTEASGDHAPDVGRRQRFSVEPRWRSGSHRRVEPKEKRTRFAADERCPVGTRFGRLRITSCTPVLGLARSAP